MYRFIHNLESRQIDYSPGPINSLILAYYLGVSTLMSLPSMLYGQALGNEFLVNSTITNEQFAADIAMDEQGNFIVVWENKADPLNFDVSAQRFSADGTALRSDF